MNDSWFDLPTFIKFARSQGMSLDEGTYLRNEILQSRVERRVISARRKREALEYKRRRRILKNKKASRGERKQLAARERRDQIDLTNDRKELQARQARERGQAKALDIASNQRVYMDESIDDQILNLLNEISNQSGKTRKRRDMFRGFDDFRKELRMSMQMYKDDKDFEKKRKRAERDLLEAEGEEEVPEDQPQEEGGEPQQEVNPNDPMFIAQQHMMAMSIFMPLRSKLNYKDTLSKLSLDNLKNFGILITDEDETGRKISLSEQVVRAMIVLSRIASGASGQELNYTLTFMGGKFSRFTKEAFLLAKKLLEKMNTLDGTVLNHFYETAVFNMDGSQPTAKLFTSDKRINPIVNQNKIFITPKDENYDAQKMMIFNLFSTMDLNQMQITPTLAQGFQTIASQFGKTLFNSTQYEALMNDPNINNKIKKNLTELVAKKKVLDENGMVLPQASLEVFKQQMEQLIPLFIQDINKKKNPVNIEAKKALIGSYLSGQDQNPIANATHIVRDNGIYAIDDALLTELAGLSKIKFKKFKRKLFEEEMPEVNEKTLMKSLVFKTTDIMKDPVRFLLSLMLESYDFETMLCLNPMLKVKDLKKFISKNNIIRVNGKEITIPVVRSSEEQIEFDSLGHYMDVAEQILINSDKPFAKLLEQKLINRKQFINLKKSKKQLDPETLVALALAYTYNNAPESITEEKRDRDYKKEYREYHGKPEQIKRRAKRVTARRKLARQGRVKKGDGKDVDHKDGNPMNNSEKNLRVQDKSTNRSNNKKYKGMTYEEHGAGDEGTKELLLNYLLNTPGQDIKRILNAIGHKHPDAK